MKRREGLVAVGLAIALFAINLGIARYERLLQNGTRVLLPLQQYDPRALLQGDYMAIDYDDESRIHDALVADACGRRGRVCGGVTTQDEIVIDHDGYAVFRLDARDIGRFVRVQSGAMPLKRHEVAVRVRLRGYRTDIAGNAWFFPEGQGAHFANARYGELRVADDGTALLAGLYDRDRNRL